MGFWNKMRTWGSSVYSSTKEGVKIIAKKTAEGIKYLGEKLEEAGDSLERAISKLGKKETGPSIDYPLSGYSSSSIGGSSISNQTLNEEKIKKETQFENDAITKYQNEFQKRAKKREKSIKKTYLDTYKNYLVSFSKIFDEDMIAEIENYVKGIAKKFDNTLRNKVNNYINPSYIKWKQLLASNPPKHEVQQYCDDIYTEADNELLDLLQSAIENTNKYICDCIIKHNEDKAKALTELKNSLVMLSSDEETKAQELQKIAEELVVAQFIEHNSSSDLIDN